MTDQGLDTGGSKLDFEEELSDIEEFVSEAQESVEDYITRLQSEDRSRIAKMIVWLFIIACLGIIGFIMVAVLSGAPTGWQDGAKQMVIVLSSVILPVVTLVIGYYFGAETKQK